jgi:hypothetical protein
MVMNTEYKSWLDKIVQKIDEKSEQAKQKQIRQMLINDYFSELNLSKRLQLDALSIPYEFLRERILKIAGENAEHARLLKEHLEKRGGSFSSNQFAQNDQEPTQIGYRNLIRDFEAHKALEEEYIRQINLIDDEETKRILKRIQRNKARQKELLLDTVMRIS